MHGAEKIFIHGEQVARQRDLEQEIKDRIGNTQSFLEDSKSYTNEQINNIPAPDPQVWVDSGFIYKSKEQGTAPVEVIVEPFGSSGYTFEKKEDNYYHANNIGIDDSYAMSKIRFINNSSHTYKVYLEVMNKSEQNVDKLLVSSLDNDLVEGAYDVSNAETILSSGAEETVTIEKDIAPGEHTLTVKYMKDNSISIEGEYSKFRPYVQDYIIKEETKHVATTEDVDHKINQSISAVYKYKGSVANKDALPTTAEVGDVYNTEDTGNNYAWDGTKWDALAGTVDMSDYYNKSQIDAKLDPLASEDYVKSTVASIGDIPKNLSELNNDAGFVTGSEALKLSETAIAPVRSYMYDQNLMDILRNLCSIVSGLTPDASDIGERLAKSSFCLPTTSSSTSYYIGQPALFESVKIGSYTIDSTQTLKAGKAGTYDTKLTYKENNIMAFGTGVNDSNEVTSLQIVWAVYEIYLNKADLKSDSTNKTDYAVIQSQWCREAFNYDGTA